MRNSFIFFVFIYNIKTHENIKGGISLHNIIREQPKKQSIEELKQNCKNAINQAEYNFVLIGEYLNELKEEMKKEDANFMEWLEEDTRMSYSTANRYMKVAEGYKTKENTQVRSHVVVLGIKKAYLLCEVLKDIPISLSDNAIFAGTQRDAFAKSYALINPSFTVEGFSGYCDPMAIYNDIEPNDIFTEERIDTVRSFTAKSKMVKMLKI